LGAWGSHISAALQMCPPLLLGNALNVATSLINNVMNEMLRQFAPLSDISQGSVVTTLEVWYWWHL